MAPYRIALGRGDRLAQLFAYPDTADPPETLADAVLHWFRLTLENDGTAKEGVVASVAISADNDYTLVLDGGRSPSTLALYGSRLPKFLSNGWDALTTVVPQIKADGKWDPSPDPSLSYRPWQFFLPLGMAMANQRSVQFFHYPPIRLLKQTRDYLKDPVPARWFELLEANDVPASDMGLYNTVMDATPIAAEDDQGSKSEDEHGPVGDSTWGLIPIQYFGAYQKAQVELLLNPAPGHSGFTVPIVVYGAHPKLIFEQLYGVRLGTMVEGEYQFIPAADIAEIIPGLQTPIVGANHPYNFYAEAQGFHTVGSGKWLSADRCAKATTILRGDLAIARWQKLMADDPSRLPQDVLAECTSYWNDSAQAGKICALVRHQGSLSYPDGASLNYRFDVPLERAAVCCSANGNDAFKECEPVP